MADVIAKPEEGPWAVAIDSRLQIALKQLDLDINWLEYQTQLLHVWEMELDVEGRRLDLAAQIPKPMPLP